MIFGQLSGQCPDNRPNFMFLKFEKKIRKWYWYRFYLFQKTKTWCFRLLTSQISYFSFNFLFLAKNWFFSNLLSKVTKTDCPDIVRTDDFKYFTLNCPDTVRTVDFRGENFFSDIFLIFLKNLCQKSIFMLFCFLFMNLSIFPQFPEH